MGLIPRPLGKNLRRHYSPRNYLRWIASMRYCLIAVTLLAGCALQPLDHDKLRAHAERNCRVHAAVNKQYAVDSTGVSTKNSAYEMCMHEALRTASVEG